ncbi:YchJ family protein [Halomonas caseinilytica]|uniref:UPF0225 protein SAMN05192556_101536 n=1 Tax=Halomonas caseinilytica TaxID=438744 RepID=A0A1M6NVV5_9GAMM|nr:YchJ family protein [Halomonas caseinilytica]SHJ99889.1 SEC-C motif-containing protein [Halomonas caseinilytica]
MNDQRCPCGTGRALAECCGRYHAGSPAPTPEALMRSRFSAFALGRNDYLLATWHPDFRPSSLPDEDPTEWVRLEIVDTWTQGDQGHVQFRATFREGRRWGVLEEASEFRRHEGLWCYVDGEPRVMRLKPGRNDACPCGSGKKAKHCCIRG